MSPCRVLICEDEAGYRALLRTVLAAEDGVEVVAESRDGTDCVAKAAESGADVVLLDLNMPRMNGYEAIPRIREAAPDARIVVLSSAPAAENARRVVDLGAAGYVQKPRNIFRLLPTIRSVLADTA